MGFQPVGTLYRCGFVSLHNHVMCVHAKLPQLCPTLCNPMDCSLPGSSVHETLQAKYWSGLPCPPPGNLPDPGIEPTSLMSPELAGSFFTTSTTWESYSLKSIYQSINLCVCFNLLLFLSRHTNTSILLVLFVWRTLIQLLHFHKNSSSSCLCDLPETLI